MPTLFPRNWGGAQRKFGGHAKKLTQKCVGGRGALRSPLEAYRAPQTLMGREKERKRGENIKLERDREAVKEGNGGRGDRGGERKGTVWPLRYVPGSASDRPTVTRFQLLTDNGDSNGLRRL